MSTIDIGGLSVSQNYSGFVDGADPFDLYKFSLSGTGNFKLSLGGISNNADVQLLNSSGNVLSSSTNHDTTPETINVDNLAAGNYAVKVFQVSGNTNYNLSLTRGASSTYGANSQVDLLTGFKFESGYFTVGETGEIGVDFVHDGGNYKGELAVFSLEGIEKFTPGSVEFIKEVAGRSISNSPLGHIVISDSKEGAKFTGGLGEQNYNDGSYLGIKTFNMKPGDNFGVMLVPNGTVQEVFANPAITGGKRPLFSLVTANPLEAFHIGQIADINGAGSAFGMEDLRLDRGSDKDYNDILFKLTGATGKAVKLDEVINPAKDWRDSNLGKELSDYVTLPPVDTQPPVEIPPIDTQPPVDTTPPIDSTPPIDIQPPVDTQPPVEIPPIDTQPPVDTTPPIDSTPPIDIQPPIDTKPPVDTTLPIDPQPPVEIKPLIEIPPVDSTPPIDSQPPVKTKPPGNNNSVENIQVDPITALNIDSGYFTVGQTGEVDVDFLFDGGAYKSELALFSLAGMEHFVPGSVEFIKEATKRSLSNSHLGQVVISDSIEGAKFSGFLEEKSQNAGEYLGIKKYILNPGDKFAFMLVPNGMVQEAFDNPAIGGAKQPLFSLKIANPIPTFRGGQIADINGAGTTFAMEDLWTDSGLDNDYNDFIFQVTGAIGKAVKLDAAIAPTKDWRGSPLGKQLIDYVTTEPNQPLIGVIDTGFSRNNPDLDYRRFKLGSDRISNDNDPLLSFGEGNEHGTHILGLIAATQGNGIGIDGINDQAPIWLGRAVGSGNWADSLIEFVDAAKQSGQKNAVVNLSLDLTQINPDGTVTTRYELTPKEREAIEFARQNRVLIVTAAGNDGGVMSVLGQASQEFDNIITVGASDGSDRANYSSYGAGLDIVTEGGTIDKPVVSTVKDSLGKMAGTSVAAARVTGVASLVWAANPDLNFKQVIQILQSTTTDLKTPGWDGETGFGLLNSTAAIELAKNTVGEIYTPEHWVAPLIWDGEGKVTPTERAAEGGISIATAPQFSPTFSDNDKVDSTTPEKYYQFTVDRPGYVRWTLTRTNGSNEFPGADLVKADGTRGRFKFVSGGAVLIGTVEGQTPPISRTDGVFVDPGTYYLRLRGGANNTVQNYNLSNQFIPDSVSTFQTPANYSTTPYFDFYPDIQSKAFNGSSATGLNVSGQVEYQLGGDLSKRIAKYGLEVKETGKLNFNVLSPNGMVEVRVEKFIGSEDKTDNLAYYEFAANANYSNEITLNKGRYQIEIKANGDEVIPGQILQLPYTLKGEFSRLAPKVGEGNVPVAAGNFIKTVTSNGVDTHYYTNGNLSVQPKGYSTWYTSSTNTATPLLGGTITPIQDTVKKYSFEYYYGNGTFLNGQYTGGGDYYKGYFYANDGFYFKDQRIAQITFNSSGNKGFYKITDAAISGNSSDVGNVYITSYSDNDTSKGIFKPLNFDEALSNQGLGTEYGYIGSKLFDKNIELDLSDPDGNTSMSTSEYLPLNQATSGKSIGGGFDRQDYYRFSLDRINDVFILLNELTASSGFSVIQDLNNNGQFEPNESLGVSSGTATTQSMRTTFAAGNYYVRVFPDNPNDLNGKTNYNLKVSATPELAGNSLGQAYNVGLLNNYYGNPKGFTGALRTNHDTEDYYRFQLDRRSNVSLTLDGLITTRLGSAMQEGATPNTLLQLIRDTNNNGQVEANEVSKSVLANPTTAGSINRSLSAGNYFVRVIPEDSNPVNTAYAITMSAQSRPIPTTRWNASFINRNPDNVEDFNSYDFSNPTAVLDLGSQSNGDGIIRLYKEFGLNSPVFNVQSDNFAMEASTITRLEAGKLYKVTTKSDDGTQFFLTKVGSATTRKNLEQLGGWSNGDWRVRSSVEPAKTIYFKVPESGEYVFDVQYYEKLGDAKVDVTLEQHQPFPAETNGSVWHSEFFWWDRTKGDKPAVDFWNDRSNVIGSMNQGSSDLGGGKKGINFDWRNGLPNNDPRLPGDFFVLGSYTHADFEAGKKYRFTVKGDDGFKLLAKNHDLPENDPNKWVYITPKDEWQQSYGYKDIEFTLPQDARSGKYDLAFHLYEQGGDANFNLSWEEVPPPQKPDIKIELVDHYGQFSPSQWAKIQQAAANWERIITKDKDSSGILRISVNKGQTDDPEWFADTYEDKAFNYRINIDKPDVDLDGVDYHNNIRFNTSKLSEAENNNLLVRVAMHEIGNALGLPDDNGSPNLMHHKDLNGIITETMYSRLEERGYSVDRNAAVDWTESNNSGGGGSNNGGGGSSGTPLVAVQGADYFTARPQFYTTGNVFYPYNAPVSVGGTGGLPANCTWYASGRVEELGGSPDALSSMIGNAGTWGNNLSNGSQIVYQPQVGDIAEWIGDGHVAVVEQVNSDGSVVISESNYAERLHNIRTIYPGVYGTQATGWPDRFIRVPKVSDTANPGDGNSDDGNSDDGNSDDGNPGGGGGTPGSGYIAPAVVSINSVSSIGIRGQSMVVSGNSNTQDMQFYIGNTQVGGSLDYLTDGTFTARLNISSDISLGNYQVKVVGKNLLGSTNTFLSNSTINVVVADDQFKHPLGKTQDGNDRYEVLKRINSPGYIENKPTWIVIHGWNDKASDFEDLAQAIENYDGYKVGDQVLTLDWDAARTGIQLDDAATWINRVAQTTASIFNSWGISSSQINLVGHSLGSYVSYEISKDFGGINKLIALSPASTTLNGYPNRPNVDFSKYSQWSWAFIGNRVTDSADQARTANEFFDVDFPFANPIDSHGGTKILWTNMLKDKNGLISQYFGLEDMNSQTWKPWVIDTPGYNSQWEAFILAKDANGFGAWDSNWVVDSLYPRIRTVI